LGGIGADITFASVLLVVLAYLIRYCKKEQVAS
jgi:hypothetical protein